MFTRRAIILILLTIEIVYFIILAYYHSESNWFDNSVYRTIILIVAAYQLIGVSIYSTIPQSNKLWITNFQNIAFIILFFVPIYQVLLGNFPLGLTVHAARSTSGEIASISISGTHIFDFPAPTSYAPDRNSVGIFYARKDITNGSEITYKNIEVKAANPHIVTDAILANSNNHSEVPKKSDKSLFGRKVNRDIKKGSPILCEYVSPKYVQ